MDPLRRRSGMTLAEVMVSVGFSVVVLGAVLSGLVSVSKSTLFMADQADLNLRSRQFSAQFGADVRASSSVSAISATGVTLVIPGTSGNTTVVYAYNAGAKTLTRTANGVPRVLLRDLTAFNLRFLMNATTETPFADEVRIIEAQHSQRKTSVLRITPVETTINSRFFRRLMMNFESI